MPVTAKFSQEFYERLGHRVVDELVDWFNKADATYRTELREINELNFARFDAKVEHRFADHDAKWERRFAEHETNWERRFAEQDTKWERRFAEQDAKWEQRLSHLEVRLIRWMVGLWVTSLGATIALLKLWVG